MNTTMRRLGLALLLAAVGGATLAQPGPAASAASGPGRGMRPGGMGPGGMGPGHGPGMMRWGQDATAGWSMMSPQERSEHQQKMQAMKTREECTAYHAQHREQMAARAKERGVTMPTPRRDPCAGLPN